MNFYKKFLRDFTLLSVGISLLVTTFCIIADPYEIWHVYSKQGFNIYSSKGENIERLTKPLNFMLHHTDAQTIIFGSSRADYSLNPVTWENLTGNKTYNFAVTSATIHESFRYLEYAVATDKKLNEVILCVDFFSFVDNPEQHFFKILPVFEENRLGKFLPTLQDFQKVLFSWDAIKDSYKNFEKNSAENLNFSCHDLNGKFSEAYIDYHYSNPDMSFLGIFKAWNESVDFSTLALLENALKDFESFVKLCQENNIKLHVCIFPLYPLHYECFDPCQNVYNDWKVKLVSIAQVYDFTSFDENFINQQNFWDTSHAKLILGDEILNSIHSGNLKFGKIITPENVQHHNEEISHQRAIWRQKNISN